MAVDRDRNQIVGVKVTETRDSTAFQEFEREIKDKYQVNILCTDAYPVYKKQTIAALHIITKAETALVESKNSLIRHYLARFNRKTMRYSKQIDMIQSSLMLLFFKDNLFSLFS